MRSPLFLTLALVATLCPPAFADTPPDAHALRDNKARQVVSSVPPASLPPPTGMSSVGGTGTSAPSTTYSFSLAATNPTAVPLSAIVANQPSAATLPLSRTEAPGTQPTFIKSAPGLPDGQPILSLMMISLSRSLQHRRLSQRIIRLGIEDPPLTRLRFSYGSRR